MKLISSLASMSVLLLSTAAFAQDPPAQPATPAAPAAPATPAAEPAPAAAPAATNSSMAPSYGKGWNEKKCADAKAKGKTTPDGACPAAPAPK
jgi:hypothetical protein